MESSNVNAVEKRTPAPKRRKKRKNWKKILLWVVGILAACIILSALFPDGVGEPKPTPTPTPTATPTPEPTPEPVNLMTPEEIASVLTNGSSEVGLNISVSYIESADSGKALYAEMAVDYSQDAVLLIAMTDADAWKDRLNTWADFCYSMRKMLDENGHKDITAMFTITGNDGNVLAVMRDGLFAYDCANVIQ